MHDDLLQLIDELENAMGDDATRESLMDAIELFVYDARHEIRRIEDAEL